ncbi:mutator type transposase [Tanacetum coccineum]
MGGEYEVKGPWGDQCVVDVANKVCSCKRWELTSIHCIHAIATNYNMSLNGIEVGLPEHWVDKFCWTRSSNSRKRSSTTTTTDGSGTTKKKKASISSSIVVGTGSSQRSAAARSGPTVCGNEGPWKIKHKGKVVFSVMF